MAKMALNTFCDETLQMTKRKDIKGRHRGCPALTEGSKWQITHIMILHWCQCTWQTHFAHLREMSFSRVASFCQSTAVGLCPLYGAFMSNYVAQNYCFSEDEEHPESAPPPSTRMQEGAACVFPFSWERGYILAFVSGRFSKKSRKRGCSQ